MDVTNKPAAGLRSSVKLKLLLFSASMVLLAGGGSAAVTIERAGRDARERIGAQLEEMASLIATGGLFADGLGGIDGRSLRSFVQNAATMELPVAYVLFEDQGGNIDLDLSAVNAGVLRQLSPTRAAEWERGEREQALGGIREGTDLSAAHQSLYLELRAQSGEPLGALTVGMSDLAARKKTRDAVVSSAAIVAALLLLTLVIAFVAAGRMVRPLQKLASAMTSVAGGDLDQDLPAGSTDEVGRLSAAFNEMMAGLRQRERLRVTLGRYVSSDVAERILTEADDLDLRGEIREVSVLFLDMRSFTTLSEKLAPREMVELLNAYFDIIVSAILRYDGVINKFIGDAIMAVWGAPKANEDHAWQAVSAAWSIQRAVGAFNWKRMKERQEVIHIGIGINTGEVIAGNVGTAERLEYTVIGDEVNLAQRLEGLASPGQVLVSSSTYERVSSRVTANMLDSVKVKGRESLVTPYEVIDLLDGDAEESSSNMKAG